LRTVDYNVTGKELLFIKGPYAIKLDRPPSHIPNGTVMSVSLPFKNTADKI